METKRLWYVVVGLVVLSPLGLLAGGGPWGEWGSLELKKMIGYAPSGLSRMEAVWKWAPLRGYRVAGLDGTFGTAMGYLISAAVGVGVILLVFKAFEWLAGDMPEGSGPEGRAD